MHGTRCIKIVVIIRFGSGKFMEMCLFYKMLVVPPV